MKKTKVLLEKAQKRYEKQVNAERCKTEHEVGQKVILNVKNTTIPEAFIPKFMSKFIDPYPIVEQMFKDMYKL